MLLEINSLTKHFGGVAAVKDVSFTVGEGEIFALIGPNGAGKTTVFNMITGMLAPDAGAMVFMGKPLAGVKPHRIAAMGLTRTFQNLQLFGKMSALENVMAGAHLKGKTGFLKSLVRWPGSTAENNRIERHSLQLLEEVGLRDQAGMYASALPFGQQRLLEIARSMASNPRLVLLDEPAAGLNSAETKALAEYLKQLRGRGKSMVLVEHDMETVMEVADRIMVLNFGESICEGTPEMIRADPQVIKAYLGEDEQIA